MKLKRLFSGLLVSLIAIVSVLLCVKVSNAAGETKVDVLTASMFTATGTTYTDFSGVSGTSGAVYAGNSAKNSAGAIQIRTKNSKEGIVTTVSGGNVKKISVVFSSGSGTLDIYGKNTPYIQATDLYATASSTGQGTKIGSITTESTELTISDEYQYVGLRSKSNAMYLESISIEWEPATTYKVSFDANGFDFKEGKGGKITTPIGTETPVTLPVNEDLANAVKGYSIIEWTDGTNTRKPGESFTVNTNTMFTAKYGEDNSKTLSVKEAIALYDFLKEKTTIEFTVIGDVKKISGKNIFITDESDSSVDFELYNTSTATTGLNVGDKIIGTGYITKYNSTYELDRNCTYEKVVAPKPATAVEFEKVDTMSSLSFDWATDGNDYTVSNVSLRFGNLFTKDAYAEGATYGVLLIQNSDLAEPDFATYLAGKTLKEITADTKIINVDATPVKVNAEGVADENGEYYQFAAVLSDMDEYLTTSVTAVMYVVIGGQIYYSVEKTASVQSTAYAYSNDDALMNTLDKDVQNALSTLAKAE